MTVIEPGTTSSDLVGRVKRLLLSPSAEWERIDDEPATIKGLYVGYICILAAIPPLAGLIGGQVFGVGGLGFSFKPSLVSAIVGAIVLSIIIGAVTGAIAGAAMFGAASRVASAGHSSGTVEFNGTKVDMAKLEAASKQMEAASQQMRDGKTVPTVPADTLKGLLPGDVAGFSRTSLETQSGGAASMSMSSARGEYTKGDASFTLAVTDLGGMAGMAAMAGAIDAQSSEETASGYKKVGKVGGRMTTEEWDRDGKYGQYSVLVGDRFSVEANGTADSIDALKQAVASVDMGRLESLAR